MASKKQRALEILTRLKRLYPDATCSLDYKTTLQLLVATILSAQCTDERVNKVTPALFEAYPDVYAFAEADLEDLEQPDQIHGLLPQQSQEHSRGLPENRH
jgi:endonuclease-3